MKKLLVPAIILIAIAFSCEKETTSSPTPEVCNVTGTYDGTAKDRFNTLLPNTYRFFENNYVTSSAGLTEPENAFGGYRNTCDSVIWNAHNNINSHTYLYKCVLSDNRTKLTGSYQDWTIRLILVHFL